MAVAGGSLRTFSGNFGILVGGSLALLFLNIINSSYSTVLSLIKGELALSYTLSGALMSSYFLGYTVGQVPGGYLADRIGARRVITLSLLGAASSTVLFGFSVDILQVIAARFLAGLLGAGIFVPCVKLVSSWFSPGERGTALGILNIGGSVGLIIASWTTPLLSVSLGWRGAIVIFGSIGILTSALVWLKIEDRSGLQLPENNRGLEEIISARSFWILAATQFMRLGAYYTFIAWLPLLYQEEYGLSLVAAGTAFSLFNFAGLVSNPLGGFISDRVGEKSVILASFFTVALSILLFMFVKSFPVLYFSAFAIGWFINFVRSPSFTILPKLYGADAAGKISGIHNTFASVGALSLPLLLGYVKDSTLSYQMGFLALSILLLFGTLICLFIKKF